MWFLVNFSTPFDNIRNETRIRSFRFMYYEIGSDETLWLLTLKSFALLKIYNVHTHTQTQQSGARTRTTHVSSAKCRANSFAVAQNIYNKPHNMRAFLMCKVTSIIGHKLFRFRAWWCIGPLHMPNTSMMKRRERTSNP